MSLFHLPRARRALGRRFRCFAPRSFVPRGGGADTAPSALPAVHRRPAPLSAPIRAAAVALAAVVDHSKTDADAGELCRAPRLVCRRRPRPETWHAAAPSRARGGRHPRARALASARAAALCARWRARRRARLRATCVCVLAWGPHSPRLRRAATCPLLRRPPLSPLFAQ